MRGLKAERQQEEEAREKSDGTAAGETLEVNRTPLLTSQQQIHIDLNEETEGRRDMTTHTYTHTNGQIESDTDRCTQTNEQTQAARHIDTEGKIGR